MKNDFNNLETVEELMKYMDDNISYGWHGIDNVTRINSLKEFKEYYRTMSIEDIIKYKVGTCPDQVNLIKSFLDNKCIENKILALVGYENIDGIDKERVHFLILYRENEIWYQFEHASRFFKGIFKYGNIADAKNKILFKYKDILKNANILEIESIPFGLDYNSLREIIIKKLNNL